MRNPVRSKINRQTQRRRPLGLLVLLVLWSTLIGSGLSLLAQLPGQTQPNAFTSAVGTVDVIPQRYQLGQELYLENCASCHVALPPEITPTETWRRLLLEPEQHYGQQLKPLIGPSLLVMWDYLRTFSRPQAAKEQTPYRVSESRFFKALHPRVKFTERLSPASCTSYQSGAAQHNYRRLAPKWENSP